MKPMIIEQVHTAKAGMPTVPAMPPIEKTTRAGTPLATQKAPLQSMARLRVFSPATVLVALLTDIVSSPRFRSHSVDVASLRPALSPAADAHCAVSCTSPDPLARKNPDPSFLHRTSRLAETRDRFS